MSEPTPTLSEEERAHTRAAVVRLAGELGLPDDAAALMRPLAMALVAWSNGELKREEISLIRKTAAEARVGAEAIESSISAEPGPFFRHRILHLLVALRLDGQIEDAASEAILESARAVARAAGGLLGIGTVSAEERSALDAIEPLSPRAP